MQATKLSKVDITATRVSVYRCLLAALAPPSREQHRWMCGGSFANSLNALCVAFGIECPSGDLVPSDWQDHESRYLACFEVGLPFPPVPLLASHYQHHEPVPRVIHEHILFYRCFGLPVPGAEEAPADHLLYQLAFLVHLDELIGRDKVDPQSAIHARRDFLNRHVVRWVGEASRQAKEKHLPVVYCALLAVLREAVTEDLERATVDRDGLRG